MKITTKEMLQIPVIDVAAVRESIQKKLAVIYCRVSSFQQNNQYSVSFEVQEIKGQNCARLFNLKVDKTLKIVESAYNGKLKTLKKLISEYRGKNILIYDVSRFCRNVENGMQLLGHALTCNTRLFFVSEGIVWDRNHLHVRETLRLRLTMAEEESKAIARRVSDARTVKKRNGFFIGGKAKYGYKKIDVDGGKKLIEDENEQNVINFIRMCRTQGTSLRTMNRLMRQISTIFGKKDSLELEFEGQLVDSIQEHLSYQNIADLLNDYEVMRRDTNWTAASVSATLKVKDDEVVQNLNELSF